MIYKKIYLALLTKKFIKRYRYYPIDQISQWIDDDIKYDYIHNEDFDDASFMLDEIHGTIQEEIISYHVRFFIKDPQEDLYNKIIICIDKNKDDLETIQAMSTCFLSSHVAFMMNEERKMRKIYHLYAYCHYDQMLQRELDAHATLNFGFKNNDGQLEISQYQLTLLIVK